MRLRLVDITLHAVRITACAAALALVPLPWSPLPAIGLFLALFAASHDLAHGALGLPRRAGDVALAVLGVAMAASGHGARRTHLHHHARLMADDDLEGAAAHMSLARACLAAPRVAALLRVAGYRMAARRDRRWQLVENAACVVALALAAIAPGAVQIYVAVALLAQLTAPVWAGWLAHWPPRWLVRILAPLAFTRSPTILGLVFHELHHARPKVPCQQLGRASEAASCRTLARPALAS
jgi:fatty acid desaturase